MAYVRTAVNGRLEPKQPAIIARSIYPPLRTHPNIEDSARAYRRRVWKDELVGWWER